MPKFIIFDGIIGSGKSTLIKKFAEYMQSKGIKAKAILEPIEQWRSSGALLRYYSDIKANCYEFQTFANVTRIQNILRNIDKETEVYLLEGSIYTDKFVYIELLEGEMGNARLRLYDEFWDLTRRMLPFVPNLFIYLDTSIKTAMNRLAKRGRLEEINGVSTQYLCDLKQANITYYNDILPDLDLESVILGNGYMEIDLNDDEYVTCTLSKIFEIVVQLVDGITDYIDESQREKYVKQIKKRKDKFNEMERVAEDTLKQMALEKAKKLEKEGELFLAGPPPKNQSSINEVKSS